MLNAKGSGHCFACDVLLPADGLEVDHIKALSNGGKDEIKNVQLLCRRCHLSKTNVDRRGNR
ncbi:HNH endonuclease [Streptomyces antarcticus]|uniref:HNH endonuclease n=1 Tax=Streptomyces antarcticus TaxID=2996458 RepID=UPI002270A1C1|nr:MULTISPECIES: HNH endonuclease signature motif containing protein [unclassified Streptomyces]MCY0943500.1 HNH endonuclease signature motif containing protein [Streptomyces sp. H34-AA3]MCZ4083591.1 HNH endonuclease signature motif containing protein [Streptomyces sp. H34-S5]